MGYSTTIGVSGPKYKLTVGLKGAALLNKFRYLKAKDKLTVSSISKIHYSSFLADSLGKILIEPFPASVKIENLT